MLEQFPWLADALENEYVVAGLIVLGSIIVAKIADWIIFRIIRVVASKTESEVDDQVIQVLHRPVFLTVVFLGLYAAAASLMLSEQLFYWVRGGLATATIVVWTTAFNRVIRIILGAVARNADRFQWIEARTVPLFDNILKLLVLGAAAYLLLQAWQLNVTPWLASAGIVGIALGFAAKDTLANLFSGIFILADAPYKIGDWIVLDTGDRGEVVAIGLRTTRLLTRDDVEVTLPNAVIANAKIINESGGPHEKRRVTVNIGVAYGSDVDVVREALLAAAAEVDYVVDDPAPRVRFTSFGDSSLNFRLLGWVEKPVERGRALDALNTAVYRKFQERNVEIPFPQTVVHMAPRTEG